MKSAPESSFCNKKGQNPFRFVFVATKAQNIGHLKPFVDVTVIKIKLSQIYHSFNIGFKLEAFGSLETKELFNHEAAKKRDETVHHFHPNQP